MIKKLIRDLPNTTSISDNDLLLLSDTLTYNIKWSTIKNYLIESIVISFNDGTITQKNKSRQYLYDIEGTGTGTDIVLETLITDYSLNDFVINTSTKNYYIDLLIYSNYVKKISTNEIDDYPNNYNIYHIECYYIKGIATAFNYVLDYISNDTSTSFSNTPSTGTYKKDNGNTTGSVTSNISTNSIAATYNSKGSNLYLVPPNGTKYVFNPTYKNYVNTGLTPNTNVIEKLKICTKLESNKFVIALPNPSDLKITYRIKIDIKEI